MNNIAHIAVQFEDSANTHGNNDLSSVDCSRLPEIFQPSPSNVELMNFTRNEVFGNNRESGTLGLPGASLNSPLEIRPNRQNCDVIYTEALDQNPSISCDEHSLLTPAPVFAPQSSATVVANNTDQENTFYGEQTGNSNKNPQLCACTGAMTTNAEDSLFSDTMRALLQSAPLSLESISDRYTENSATFNTDFDITSKDELLDAGISKRQKMTSHSTEDNNGQSLNNSDNTNGLSSNILPTLRSILESDSSEVPVSAPVGQYCQPISVHLNQFRNPGSIIDGSEGLISIMLGQPSLNCSHLPIRKSLSSDSTTSLQSSTTLTGSRSCSQSPTRYSHCDHDASLTIRDGTRLSADEDSCCIFDNDDTQSSVIRLYKNLQLNESAAFTSEPETISQDSPVLLQNFAQQHNIVVSDCPSHPVFMHPERLTCDRSMDEDHFSSTSLSLGPHDPLNLHVQSFSNAPLLHHANPSSTDEVDADVLPNENQVHNALALTTEPALLLLNRSSAEASLSSSSGDAPSSTGQTHGFGVDAGVPVSPTYLSQTVGSVEASTAQLDRTNATIDLVSAPHAQRFHGGQLVVSKKFRPLVHHRHTLSIARDSSNSVDTIVSTGPVPPRRLTGMTHLRDRSTELVHSYHPPSTNVIGPHVVHAVRQCHLPLTRSIGPVQRASLLPGPIGARKRTNRSTGSVSHMLGSQFVGAIPCARRKYAFSAPHRTIGSHCPHPALHSVSGSTITGISHIDSARPVFHPSQMSDSARSQPTNRVTSSKLTPTIPSSPTLRNPLNSAAPCRTAQLYLPPPSPYQVFPDRSVLHQYQIHIVRQPEAQHRARYQTEGSRGAVKDRSGSDYPSVQLSGWKGRASLQVFVACESGRVRPHPFYQAYLIAGKSTKYCIQTILDGVNVIEMPFSSADNWTLSVECVGILKLRKSDLEHRAQASSALRHRQPDGNRVAQGNSSTTPASAAPSNQKLGTRRPGKARLVFRALLFQEDSNNGFEVIQVASEPVLCTQIIGDPEVCRISFTEASIKGGQDLFILGKNLGKDCRVWFCELSPSFQRACPPNSIKFETCATTRPDDNSIYPTESEVSTVPYVWQAEGVLDSDYSHQTHLVCRVPAYTGPSCPLMDPLGVELVVCSGDRRSLPHRFTYLPIRFTPEISSIAPVRFPLDAVPDSGQLDSDSSRCYSIDKLFSIAETKDSQASTNQRSTIRNASDNVGHSACCPTMDSRCVFNAFQLSTTPMEPAVSVITPMTAYNGVALAQLSPSISGLDVCTPPSMPLENQTAIDSRGDQQSTVVLRPSVPDYPNELNFIETTQATLQTPSIFQCGMPN